MKLLIIQDGLESEILVDAFADENGNWGSGGKGVPRYLLDALTQPLRSERHMVSGTRAERYSATVASIRMAYPYAFPNPDIAPEDLEPEDEA